MKWKKLHLLDLSTYQKQFEDVQQLVAWRAVFNKKKVGCVGSDTARLNVMDRRMGTRENMNEEEAQRYRVTNCGLKEEATRARDIEEKT